MIIIPESTEIFCHMNIEFENRIIMYVSFKSQSGSSYTASLIRNSKIIGENGFQIEYVNKSDEQPKKKCRVCDKSHFTRRCNFTDLNVIEQLKTELVKAIRMQALLLGLMH